MEEDPETKLCEEHIIPTSNPLISVFAPSVNFPILLPREMISEESSPFMKLFTNHSDTFWNLHSLLS